MEIRNLDHLESLIGSINKMFLNAQNKGILKAKELSLLNLVYKLLKYDCFTHMDHSDQRKLLSLYYKLFNKYSFLCKTELSIADYTTIHTTIVREYINTNNNTAPEIEDPDPVEPEVPAVKPPKLCENSKSVIFGDGGISKRRYNFTADDLVECFIDQEGGVIKNIKIVTLPTSGYLVYNEENVEVGDIIDVELLTMGQFYYYNLLSADVDSFKYQVSGSMYPNVYEEEQVTMFIDL